MDYHYPPDTEPGHRVRARDRGLRRVRGVSNWTAVAVIAATGAAAGYFAQAAHSPAAVSVGSPSPATIQGASQPCLTTPVATTGGSGVAVRPPAQTCGPGANGSGPVSTYPAAGERERD